MVWCLYALILLNEGSGVSLLLNKYGKQLFHVGSDIIKSHFGIDLSEILVFKILKYKTSSFHGTAPDNIKKLHDIGMIQTLIDVILSPNFIGFDGQQYFDGYFLFVSDIMPWKHVRVLSSS